MSIPTESSFTPTYPSSSSSSSLLPLSHMCSSSSSSSSSACCAGYGSSANSMYSMPSYASSGNIPQIAAYTPNNTLTQPSTMMQTQQPPLLSQYPPPPLYNPQASQRVIQQQPQQPTPTAFQLQQPSYQVSPGALTQQTPPKPRGNGRKGNSAAAALALASATQNNGETIRSLMKQLESQKREYFLLASKSAEAAFVQHQKIIALEQKLAETEKCLTQASQSLARLSVDPLSSKSDKDFRPTHCEALMDIVPILKLFCQHLEAHAIRYNVLLICVCFKTKKES